MVTMAITNKATWVILALVMSYHEARIDPGYQGAVIKPNRSQK
ncbi:MAG: hypothetical protein ETSY1_02660 [Candidatus Entotheonella factor]|uniref:Uncharacterized protein n=1 Tax=Entotheonella factor TaxID=1429438 RepID=W4LZ82_ENTF1|nr:MAG: hypothetical protein ETSY1_02660 [Candidatus Entotheonella factor]